MTGVKNEDVVKAAGAFGGGIAASGGPCGIMLGTVAFFSSMYSRGNLEGKEDPRMWTLSKKFMKKFDVLCEKFGGANCVDIARVNWHDKDEARDYYKNPESKLNTLQNRLSQNPSSFTAAVSEHR